MEIKGCFPFVRWSLAPTDLLPRYIQGIRSLIGLVSFRPVKIFQCSTPLGNARRYA